MWTKLMLRLKGWKTLLLARLYVVAGALVALHDIALPTIAGVDWAPLTANFPAWAVPMLIAVTGIVFELLRHATTGPVRGKDGG